jgi:hypothetical protein
MPDGTFADELSFGIILKRTEEQEAAARQILEDALQGIGE